MELKFNNLAAENKFFQKKIEAAIAKVIASGHYLFGPETEKLEENFKKLTHKKYAVSVKNATDAITMVSTYILEQSQVSTFCVPEFGAFPTAIAIQNALNSSATCIPLDFIPVDQTFTIDPHSKSVKNRNVIAAVDLFGNESNVQKIRENNPKAFIIHDCAQATDGNRDYSHSDAVIFSFYPTKPLASMGDGGMICTDNENLYNWLKEYRFYGYKKDGSSNGGINSRMDEIQAAILNVKFPRLDWMNLNRTKIASIYKDAMPFGLKTMENTQNCVWHQFPIQFIDERMCNRFKLYLKTEGIPHLTHYPRMVYQLGWNEENMADDHKNHLSKRIVSIPCHSWMTQKEVDKVANFLRSIH